MHAVIVNKEEDTPLCLESAHGNLDWVKALISEHANPNGEHYFPARLFLFRELYNLLLERTTKLMCMKHFMTILSRLYTGNIILLDLLRSRASNCDAYAVAHYWFIYCCVFFNKLYTCAVSTLNLSVSLCLKVMH